MKESRMSKSASGLPSISTTRPLSMRADGAGSHGLWKVAKPASGSSAAKRSCRSGRLSHSSKRRQRGGVVMASLPYVERSEPSQPHQLNENEHDDVPEDHLAEREPALHAV